MKKLVYTLTPLFCMVVLLSCGPQKSASPAAMSQLQEMVNQKWFSIHPQWASPMATQSLNAVANAGLIRQGSNASRIDIAGNRAFLKMKNDSVFADLPYFGERQMGGAYSPDEAGITFSAPAKDVAISFNDKKQRYQFKFGVVNKYGEVFNVSGNLYPNGKSTFTVNSSERLSINYTGQLTEEKQTP